jgi:FkbM family methyltransferase
MSKLKSLVHKIKVIFSQEKTTKEVFFSLVQLVRYAVGQLLAYSGVGQYLSFTRHSYRIFLTKSPVAMVMFGYKDEERQEEIFGKQVIQKNDIVIDIGANIGTFSLAVASLVGETGKVFAFEAHSKTFSYFLKNIKANSYKNITAYNLALGEKEGELHFSSDSNDDVNHVIKSGGLKVPVTTLDRIPEIVKEKRIQVIKLDVEGYEIFVLEGAKETLTKTKYVYFEVYEPNVKEYNYHVEEIYDFLIAEGFSIVDPDTRKIFPREGLRADMVQNLLAINQKL